MDVLAFMARLVHGHDLCGMITNRLAQSTLQMLAAAVAHKLGRDMDAAMFSDTAHKNQAAAKCEAAAAKEKCSKDEDADDTPDDSNEEYSIDEGADEAADDAADDEAAKQDEAAASEKRSKDKEAYDRRCKMVLERLRRP